MASITSVQNPDIFGRRPLMFGGAFAADSACINLGFSCGGTEIPGLLTQQMSVQYSQPVTRLYEVGSQKTYYVAGRPQGSCNLARVLGPGAIFSAFYSCLGNVCNANQNDLCFCVEPGCLGEDEDGVDECGDPLPEFSSMDICMKNVVLQSIGFSVAAQDMMINEQLSLFFTAMLVCDSNGCQCEEPCEITCDCFSASCNAA